MGGRADPTHCFLGANQKGFEFPIIFFFYFFVDFFFNLSLFFFLFSFLISKEK